ncbi:MAG: 50S ribosomal protein L2, partial [Thermoplasmata archaeon]
MGKRILCQRRGRGTSKFKIPSHRYLGEIKYPYDKEFEGVVEEIVRDAIHSAPIAVARSEEGRSVMFLAAEGIKVGDKIKITDSDVAIGNVLPLGKIPEGYPVYNIEMEPGDGGKLVRAAGSYATIVSHTNDKTVIQLPS